MFIFRVKQTHFSCRFSSQIYSHCAVELIYSLSGWHADTDKKKVTCNSYFLLFISSYSFSLSLSFFCFLRRIYFSREMTDRLTNESWELCFFNNTKLHCESFKRVKEELKHEKRFTSPSSYLKYLRSKGERGGNIVLSRGSANFEA